MIGSLIGLIKEKTPSAILLEVNGIGYEISIPLSTSFQLPKVGESAFLLTHLVVREDQHSLYGFATEEERKLFRALIKISGVGAKLAITILSGTNVTGFIQSVVNEDIDALVHLPGIGKKTAERLVVEMKDKISEISEILSFISTTSLSAVFLPMPGKWTRASMSSFTTDWMNPVTFVPERIVIANLAPTPLIFISALNNFLSSSVANP